MRGVVTCPGVETPGFNASGFVTCSGGGSPMFVTEPGLSSLTWEDVSGLMGALLVAVAIAAAYNTVSKMFWGR